MEDSLDTNSQDNIMPIAMLTLLIIGVCIGSIAWLVNKNERLKEVYEFTRTYEEKFYGISNRNLAAVDAGVNIRVAERLLNRFCLKEGENKITLDPSISIQELEVVVNGLRSNCRDKYVNESF